MVEAAIHHTENNFSQLNNPWLLNSLAMTVVIVWVLQIEYSYFILFSIFGRNSSHFYFGLD